MKTARVRTDRSSLFEGLALRLSLLGTLALGASVIGCSAAAEGGSGGSSSGSGGSTSSGGNSGSGGNTGSGGNSSGSGGHGSGGSTSGSGGSGSGGSGSGGSSTGSGGSGSGGSSMTTCDAPGMIFHDSKVGCLGSGCHESGQQPPDLSGNDGSVLKGKKSQILCAGNNIVNPADPTSSVMYKVLSGSSCLIQMRVDGPYLTSEQLDCVKAWISNIK